MPIDLKLTLSWVQLEEVYVPPFLFHKQNGGEGRKIKIEKEIVA